MEVKKSLQQIICTKNCHGQIFHTLNAANWFEKNNLEHQSGEVLNVVPLLLKSVVNNVEYTLTHAMQYENYTIVSLTIKSRSSDNIRIRLLPRVILQLSPGFEDYLVVSDSLGGTGNPVTMQFRILPTLPDKV